MHSEALGYWQFPPLPQEKKQHEESYMMIKWQNNMVHC
jgi:hypothetical protein